MAALRSPTFLSTAFEMAAARCCCVMFWNCFCDTPSRTTPKRFNAITFPVITALLSTCDVCEYFSAAPETPPIFTARSPAAPLNVLKALPLMPMDAAMVAPARAAPPEITPKLDVAASCCVLLQRALEATFWKVSIFDWTPV